MKKYLVILSLAILATLAGAGIATALPANLTDSSGATPATATTGTGATYQAKTGGGAEHIYSDRPADKSYGPHGKFTTDTNACGRCHQLHQAQSARLIRFNISSNASGNNDIYKICTYCHNFNGQSTYDVKDGMIWDTQNGDRYATNGGGFERQLIVEGPNTAATLVKSVSSHRVNESLNAGAYIRFLAPGGAQGGTGDHIALKCSSCHNPHGSKNARILAESVAVTDSDGTSDAHNITPTLTGGSVPEFVANRFGDEVSIYPIQISEFCATCHKDYLNTNKTGSETSGTNDTTKYRHKINMPADNGFNYNPAVAYANGVKTDGADGAIGGAMSDGSLRNNDGSFGFIANRFLLPLGTNAANPLGGGVTANRVVCTTCHFAHGTFAQMTKDVVALRSAAPTDVEKMRVDANAATPVTLYKQDSVDANNWNETIKNLRLDNRAVCQNCHNRSSVDTATPPTLVDVINPQLAVGSVDNYAAAGTTLVGVKAKRLGGVVIIRFDQYMSKSAAQDVTNYSLVGGGGGNPAAATLQLDGRTVVLSGGNVGTAASVTLDTTNLKNINGVANSTATTGAIQ